MKIMLTSQRNRRNTRWTSASRVPRIPPTEDGSFAEARSTVTTPAHPGTVRSNRRFRPNTLPLLEPVASCCWGERASWGAGGGVLQAQWSQDSLGSQTLVSPERSQPALRPVFHLPLRYVAHNIPSEWEEHNLPPRTGIPSQARRAPFYSAVDALDVSGRAGLLFVPPFALTLQFLFS